LGGHVREPRTMLWEVTVDLARLVDSKQSGIILIGIRALTRRPPMRWQGPYRRIRCRARTAAQRIEHVVTCISKAASTAGRTANLASCFSRSSGSAGSSGEAPAGASAAAATPHPEAEEPAQVEDPAPGSGGLPPGPQGPPPPLQRPENWLLAQPPQAQRVLGAQGAHTGREARGPGPRPR
jgi:hypothetical protein